MLAWQCPPYRRLWHCASGSIVCPSVGSENRISTLRAALTAARIACLPVSVALQQYQLETQKQQHDPDLLREAQLRHRTIGTTRTMTISPRRRHDL
jgi:hypothetical protein